MATPTQVSIALTSARIPLSARHVRDPVIAQKYDLSATRHISKNAKVEEFDSVVPTLLFADNVLPTTYGYKSANYLQVASAISQTAVLHCLHTVSISPGVIYLYAYVTDDSTPANNGHWALRGSGDWEQLREETISFGDPSNKFISLAIINGRAFAYFAFTKCVELGDSSVTDVALTGITASSIAGCFSSSGYLMLWDKVSIYRSSLVSPEDFIPSSVTGAGSESPQDVRGEIKLCKSTQNGFMVYADTNCVYAQYSQDFRAPFVYKEIGGIAGIDTGYDVSTGSSQEHLVKSGAAFSALVRSELTTIFQEVTEAAASKLFDSFDIATGVITEETYSDVETRLASIPGGIFICSYRGIQDIETDSEAGIFSHALVYSNALARYAKLTIPHAFCAQWPFDTSTTFLRIRQLSDTVLSSYQTSSILQAFSTTTFGRIFGTAIISFIKRDGSAHIIWEDSKVVDSDATLVLGPFELVRGKYTMLTGVMANNCPNAICSVITADSGGSQDRIAILPKSQLGNASEFKTRITGAHHLICFYGQFDLSSVILKLTAGGALR